MTAPRGTGRWTDEQVERFVGNLRRWGVLTAAAVLVLVAAATALVRRRAMARAADSLPVQQISTTA